MPRNFSIWWLIGHKLKNPIFYIKWACGLRRLNWEWKRCNEHDNCWTRNYDFHLPTIHKQIELGIRGKMQYVS